MKRFVGTINKVFKYIISLFVDLYLIFTISIFIHKLLINFVLLSRINIFILSFFLYLILSYLVKKRTLGKYLFGIKIDFKGRKVLYNEENKFLIIFYISFLLFIIISYSYFVYYNNYNNNSDRKILGFNMPFKTIHYPNNSKVKPYTEFLNKQKKSAKEYILSLFDRYDIVILCENIHGEDTQWDLIYEIVSDEKFILEVGNVFTEYGNSRFQSRIDSLMQNKYANEQDLNKEVSKLTYFIGDGSFYFFIKKLYLLNQTLPDSLKVKEYFTDIYSQNYLTSAYYDSLNNNLDTIIYVRDSIMANEVINWYQKTKSKCLVVTNFRHAFAVNNIFKKNLYKIFKKNQAQYIFNKFPDQTFNVLLNRREYRYLYSPKLIYFKQIKNGIWNTAFRINNNKSVGFDLKDSPFGDDKFEVFPQFGDNKFDLNFSEIFKGLVFYKPEEEYTHSKSLYKKYAAEKEYLEAKKNNLIDTINAKQILKSFKNDETNIVKDKNISFINYYDFFDIIIWFILSIITIIILTIRSP